MPSNMSEIREMIIDAMRDYKQHSRQEVIEKVQGMNDVNLTKNEKINVSNVLRSYAGIIKIPRGNRQYLYKLSHAYQHNVQLKFQLSDAVNQLHELQVQLENIQLEQQIQKTTVQVVKTKRDVLRARRTLD